MPLTLMTICTTNSTTTGDVYAQTACACMGMPPVTALADICPSLLKFSVLSMISASIFPLTCIKCKSANSHTKPYALYLSLHTKSLWTHEHINILGKINYPPHRYFEGVYNIWCENVIGTKNVTLTAIASTDFGIIGLRNFDKCQIS